MQQFTSGWRGIAVGLVVLTGGLAGCTTPQQAKEEEVRREKGRGLPGGSDQPDVEPRPSLPEPAPPPTPSP